MSEDIHFIEDLEERENATALIMTTFAMGEDVGTAGNTTLACYETGCDI